MSTPWQAPPVRSRPQRPPLTKRLRPGHWVALDYLVAVPFVVAMYLNEQRSWFAYNISWGGLTGTMVLVLVAVGASLPVALRRRNPMAALAVSTAAALVAPLITAAAGTAATSVAGLPVPPGASQVSLAALRTAPVFFLPVAYVIYLVAALYRRTIAAAALGGVLFLLVGEALLARLNTAGNGSDLVFPALIVIIFWIVGYAAGQRRAYAAQLQDQAAAGAVTEERLRIARELHDVVAHSMTVIAVQAGYGHHVIDEQPGKAREALGAIQATSREALVEMRGMLGVLRQSHPAPFGKPGLKTNSATDGQHGSDGTESDGPGSNSTGSDSGPGGAGTAGGMRVTREPAPLAPAPGLADLGRLVARIGNAGVTVDLRVHGSRRELPQGIDLAAFRIVQEALTNVVKHADTPSAVVTIRYLDDDLVIEVVDEGRGCPVPAVAGARGGVGADAAGGHGLIGMRERVSLYGGELTAAPLPERGFRVAARLPAGDGAP